MSEYKPTPFELAVVSAIMALRNRESIQPTENWLGAAYGLLMDAAAYKPPLTAEETLKQMWSKHPMRAFNFDEVLKEQEPPAKGQKKGPTMVGLITTRKGLIKAIRRVFPKGADEIIKRGSILAFEIRK